MTPEPLIPGLALLKDVTIRFSIIYTRQDFEDCARALDKSAADARALVSDTVTLNAFPAAFEAFRAGAGIGKLLLDPWGRT
jgi:(R,R)-butanediol dehydrogenase/meso-butanediol dehydrogenase/diacetyl reductase